MVEQGLYKTEVKSSNLLSPTKVGIFAFFFLSGCSVFLSPPEVELECNSPICPNQENVECMVNVFADNAPGFDTEEELKVVWHGKTFTSPRFYNDRPLAGITYSPNHIEVMSTRVVGHELIHVQLWRVFGDGDNSHEEPPGYWRPEHNFLENRLADEMVEACGEYRDVT